jgi:hypothetical protein
MPRILSFDVGSLSGTMLRTYQLTRRHIPADSNIWTNTLPKYRLSNNRSVVELLTISWITRKTVRQYVRTSVCVLHACLQPAVLDMFRPPAQNIARRTYKRGMTQRPHQPHDGISRRNGPIHKMTLYKSSPTLNRALLFG